jgi:hypothetical protein
MDNSITCPHCRQNIPLTEALTHQIDEKYRIQLEQERKKSEEERQKLIEQAKKRIEEEKQKTAKEIEEQMRQKVKEELELKMKDTENAKEELQKEKRALQEQLLELTKTIRQLQSDKEKAQIELEKKLIEEQNRIREEEQKKLEEQYRLKAAEKDKQLQDALKMNDELKRKLEQGSQQTQGEVLEIELENRLKQEFPTDEIKPVPKGINGADIVQIVKTSRGQTCGTIIWETKRTKAWSNEWILKLKEDQRQMKAELAVIITQALPQAVKRFGHYDGIWVGEYDLALGLAYALRFQLLEVTSVKSAAVGKNEKMEILYTYLTGIEFKQRVEAILETFSSFQDDIEKEKRWFAQKWAKQEKNLRKVMDHTLGMHGDLQGIMGKAIGEIKGMEMLPAEIVMEEKINGESEAQTLF